MNIDSIMTTDLITVPPTENLDTARTLMHKNHIHYLPVVDDERRLVGLVTLSNVLAATDSILRDPDKRMHAKDINIKDVMVTDVATVDERASMRQAASFLENTTSVVCPYSPTASCTALSLTPTLSVSQ